MQIIKKISSGYYNVSGYFETINICRMFHIEDKKFYWYVEINGGADDLLNTKKECVEGLTELIYLNVIHPILN